MCDYRNKKIVHRYEATFTYRYKLKEDVWFLCPDKNKPVKGKIRGIEPVLSILGEWVNYLVDCEEVSKTPLAFGEPCLYLTEEEAKNLRHNDITKIKECIDKEEL